MNFPRKPQRGQKALQSIYNAVCQIIDYLPSLEVKGDSTTTSVSHSSAGTIIHAKQNLQAPKKQIVEGGEGGQQYYADGKTLQLQIVDGNNTFSIKPPSEPGNWALVCLNGEIQWILMQDC